MSIKATCVCGMRIRVKDRMAGSTLRCPGCGEAVTVPDAAELEDEPEAGEADHDVSEEETEAPAKEAHVPIAAAKPKPKRSRRTLLIAAVGLVVLLGVAAGGVYFFFFKDGRSPNAGKEPLPNSKGTSMITAEPNPVPAGPGKGTTKITWDTGDKAGGDVYVTVNGGPEKIVASGRKGSKEVTWIVQGEYEFRLYTKDRAQLLGQVKVVREKKANKE